MLANFISAIVTIIAGVIGLIIGLVSFASGVVTIIEFVEKHFGLKLSLTPLHLPRFSFAKYSAFKIPALLIICFGLIVTGIISVLNVLSPAYVISQHQNDFNQTTGSPPTYSYSMQEADEHWNTGQPSALGSSGSCNFQSRLYIVTMTLKNHYYPCYNNESSFQNFLFQVEIKIQQGDSGGIIFRDQPNRPDAYYLYLSETGTYVLGYWPNANIGGTVELFSGTSINFLRDQVKGLFSTIAVRALGDDLSLYINGIYIAHAENSILSSGRIGLVAQKTLNDTTVAYRNVRIWKL